MNSAIHPPLLLSMEAIAREAGALLMGYFRDRVKIEYKGDVDLVTIADRKSEALILERIRARLSHSRRDGRRGNAHRNWQRLPLVCRSARWHHKFRARLSGVLRFAGRRVQGRARRGRALRSDARRTVCCGEGKRRNAERQYPSRFPRPTNLAESLVATGFPSHKRHKNPNIYFYHQITLRTHGVRRAGSAALDLANVACGRYDGFWEFNLNPWDTAAGVLIVRGGGRNGDQHDRRTLPDRQPRDAGQQRLDPRSAQAGIQGNLSAGAGSKPLPSPVEYAKIAELTQYNRGVGGPQVR